MLVVLLIVGMASSLMFEGAAQVMAIRARLNQQLESLRGEALRASWLRQLVQGLQPDFADGPHKFSGSGRALSGLTTNPLSAGYGGTAPFALKIEYEAAQGRMVLRYGVDKNAPEILVWSGDKGQLRYVDSQGETHDSWPPPLGLWPQLPSAIYLEGSSGALLVVATPQGPTLPVPRQIDVMNNFFGKS